MIGSAGLLAPLQPAAFGSVRVEDIAGVMLGTALTGTAVVVILDAPILFALRRLARHRFHVPPVASALVGSVVAITPWVALNQPGGSLSAKIAVSLDAAAHDPGIASAWLPYVLGGGIFGWLLFRSCNQQPANEPLQPASGADADG